MCVDAHVYVHTSDLLSLPAKEQKEMGGDWLCLCLMSVLSIGAAEGSVLSVAVCETSRVNVFGVPVSVRVHVCVHVSGICAQLCYWLKLQRGKCQPCPPTWAETCVRGHWPGCQQLSKRGPGLLKKDM